MMTTTSSPDSDDAARFCKERLTLAREKRGLTKQQLADLCQVTRRTVTSWEMGAIEHPPVELLAKELQFPAEYFLSGDPPLIDDESVSFRALSSTTARQVRSVMASASLAVEFSDWIDQHYNLPASSFPDRSESSQVKATVAAEEMRAFWSLSPTPVKNMLALLERNGCRVFSLPAFDREVDALSFWREGVPFILLNTDRSGERMRFDLAHELGHLVLHRNQRLGRSRSIEQEAHEFAGALLIPADALYEQVVGQLRFDDLFKLKRYWRVSAMAMVERLWRLELISEWTRRQWIVELTQQGYRLGEPDGRQPESSRLLRQIFERSREDGWTLQRIAQALRIHPRELDSLVFGLALSAVDGEGISAPRLAGHLRRVQ